MTTTLGIFSGGVRGPQKEKGRDLKFIYLTVDQREEEKLQNVNSPEAGC